VETIKKSLYVETTIPSYATAKMSRDIVKAARQATTILFWETERQKYDLYISQDVVDECKLGDPQAAQRRLDFIHGIEPIVESEEIDSLAVFYKTLLNIPERAKTDCIHLAYCVKAKIDYLLSWNCAHLGDDSYRKILFYNNEHDLWTPRLVTPEYMINSLEVL
jgi:hypothetical protein